LQVVTKPARFQKNNLRAAREQIHFCVDVDPCWSVVGSGGSGDSNKGSLHKSFFMSRQELGNQLNHIMEHGFDEEFIIDSAEKFHTTDFLPHSKPVARLYLFYLSRVLKAMLSKSELWIAVTNQIKTIVKPEDIPQKAKELIEGSVLDEEPGNIALAIGAYCYAYVVGNKKSGEDFLTLFVDTWFKYFVK